MNVGILDIGGTKGGGGWEGYLSLLEKKQYVSVTPQAIAVWCRELGHRVTYANYIGHGDPLSKLPADLDVVMISTHSNSAPLAYALSKVLKRQGVRTVIGGPHAKSFPRDCLRYFDLVVLECDKSLISDILDDRFPPHSVISSRKPYDDVPTIQERLADIKTSVFVNGKPFPLSLIPMLASMGCPYTCSFCTDWNSQYRVLSEERLRQDLTFASMHLSNVKLIFYDPNFGVRFDETLDVFETIPAGHRSPYSVESSLTNVRTPERLQRLHDTNCLAVAPGIESWTQFSNKAAVGKAAHRDKLERVVEHISTINEYVPYVQTNFIFGLDSDSGDEPFALTKEFLLRVPFAFPTLNIPMAFGGTPLFEEMYKQGRILKTMPFNFYMVPYLTLILKNYDPISYFQKLSDLYSVLFSRALLQGRLTANTPASVKGVNLLRTLGFRGLYTSLLDTLHLLKTDPQLLAFHNGETDVLPQVYVHEYQRQLGKYTELMPLSESVPILDQTLDQRVLFN